MCHETRCSDAAECTGLLGAVTTAQLARRQWISLDCVFLLAWYAAVVKIITLARHLPGMVSESVA